MEKGYPKMKFTLVAGLASFAIASPALAQDSGWYGDVGYQHHSIDEEGVEGDVGTITGHVGYNFTPNLAAEGELGFGVNDEEVTVLGNQVDLGINYLAGAYGRVQAPLSENLTVFARAGFVQVELEAEGAGASASESETGAGYGVGGEFSFDGVNGVRVDYTRYDIEDLEADAFYIGYSRKF